ncbi:hypothetical protein SAMN04488564_104185 [Lentzea waywayandensis]|uniref:Helix-turn-helix domain-containing protein n=1 Tax=Lentzea waywayandensis TaxID=84724 RepID=A0A1I6EDG0_9PSEU|nr:helix-turn-helix transcriptional regulator [Lentzea waywayandensis]SFR15561.1 hypothetical protein SAMN04488564_104185 [Lentzea waywayandensis]
MMDEELSPFAKRRQTMGFSQEALAELLNIDVRTVRRWDTGDFVKALKRGFGPSLARCLQVSLEQLDALLVRRADADAVVVEGEVVSPEVSQATQGAVMIPVLLDGRQVLQPVDPRAYAGKGSPVLPDVLAAAAGEDAMSPFSRRSLLKFSILSSALPAP